MEHVSEEFAKVSTKNKGESSNFTEELKGGSNNDVSSKKSIKVVVGKSEANNRQMAS